MRAVLRGIATQILVIAIASNVAWAAETRPAEERTVGHKESDEADWTFDEKMADADIELLDSLEIPAVLAAIRHPQRADRVPYAVSIITAEDIRRSGARSIPDALRLAPGVDVADLLSGQSAVSTRGFHGILSRDVLVLADGRQIFDSAFGGTLWHAWPFQLEDIDRIEVIRGPGGVTWGANAVSGVINIITKDPADQLGATFVTRGASRGGHRQYSGYGLETDRLRLRLSGEYEASDGFSEGGSILRRLEDDYRVGRIGLHGIYDLGPEDALSFWLGSSVLDGGFAPAPAFGLKIDNAGVQTNFLHFKLNHRNADQGRIELSGFINDFQLSSGHPAIEYRYQQIGLLFSQQLRPSPTHMITWGIDNRTDLLNTGNADPFLTRDRFVSTNITGLYFQNDWEFAPKWSLQLGGRIDYDFYGGFQPSARASISRQVGERGLFFGSVSRAFQMPPAAMKFLDFPLLHGIARVKSDRTVGPETLVAYEIGYRGSPAKNLNTSFNVFWNEHKDLTVISPTLGPPGLIRVDFDNRADSSLYGAELEVEYALSDQLTLLGNYTYQQLRWKSSRPFLEKDNMSPPDHKFMLGVRYSPNEDLHLATHLYYVDGVDAPNPANPFIAKRIDPYFRLDLNAEFEFREDLASLSVGVRNLLDPMHPEGSTLFLNDAESPRMVYAELRVRLPK
jgi:iron complex outermembrane receptor protein